MRAIKKPRTAELTLSEKIQIIDEKRKPGAFIRSVVQTMTRVLGKDVTKRQVECAWKNKEEIVRLFESNCSEKRCRIEVTPRTEVQSIRHKINERVYGFFKMCRSKNLTVSGPMLQECADELQQFWECQNMVDQMDGLIVFESGIISCSGHYLVSQGTWTILCAWTGRRSCHNCSRGIRPKTFSTATRLV